MDTIMLHRRTIGRASALFLIALLLGGCGLVGSHGTVASAKKYQAEGKYRTAYIEAKKVLQRDNNNGEAWLVLGKASLMNGDPKDAADDLTKARANGVAKADWVVPMGRALVASRQFDQALKTLAPDSSLPDKLSAHVSVLRGDALRALKRGDGARKAYEKALKLKPKDSRALVGLARLTAGGNGANDANQYLKQALAAAPDDPQAWATKGDFAFAAGDVASAESAYQKALGIKHPDPNWLPQESFYTRVRLADAQTRQHRYDKALANIKTLEKMSPQQPYPHYLHAVVLFQQGQLDDTIDQLQQVLRTSPNNAQAQLLMGAAQYAQGNYGQSQMYLSNVMGVDPKNTSARKLLALTYYREGRTDDALDMLRPMAPDKTTDAQLTALLQRAAAQGIAKKAGRLASNGSGAPGPQPASAASAGAAPSGPFGKARKALASGHAEQAIKLLKAAPASSSSAARERTVLLVQSYNRAKQPKQGVATAADYVDKHPRDSEAHLLYGTALVAAGDHDKARAQYQKAHKLDANNLAALMSLGSLDTLERHFKKAASHYKAVLKTDPKHARAMVALAKLSAMQGDNAGAVKWFEKAIDAAPKSPTAYTDLVMLYSHNGQFDQAARIARKLADAFPHNASALNAVGASEINAGKHAKALKPLAEAVKIAPDVALYRINLARAQILGKDTKSAASNLAAVLKADPENTRAADLLAHLKLQQHDLEGAIALARNLQKQAKTKAAGLALEGDLYMAEKSWDKAADAYQRGLKADYSRPLVIKRFLALARSGKGKPVDVLDTWLNKHTDDAAVRMLLAQYYLDHDRNQEAATQYERVLRAHGSNVEALNNLAWIYTGQRNAKALKLAERAHKLAPKSAGIKDTYGWALIAAGKPKTALPLLEQAAKAEPDTPVIQYHLAVAQARTGNRKGARATLAALQKSGIKFDGKQDADKLYQELASGAKP